MLDLITRFALASTTLACSTFAVIACDQELAPTDAGADLAVVEASLQSGATVGWTFDVALEPVADASSSVLDLSIPVDLELAVPTRVPRGPVGGPAARDLDTADALTEPVGEVRLLDAATHEVLFAAPISAGRHGGTTWVDVRLVDPCKVRVLCQRPFRLEVAWPGPAVHATADLTDAVAHGRVILGR